MDIINFVILFFILIDKKIYMNQMTIVNLDTIKLKSLSFRI